MKQFLSKQVQTSSFAPLRAILSLNFGKGEVRFGLFRKQGSIWKLELLGSTPLPETVSSQQIAETLEEKLKAFGGLQGVGVVASWRQDFTEKPVVLPDMPASEIHAAIVFAMEHHFSLRMDECLYDWAPAIPVSQAQGMKANQYFVYSVPKKSSAKQLEVIDRLTDAPQMIAPPSVAAAGVLSTRENLRRHTGLLEIDDETSSFTIYREGKQLFSRSITVGSRHFSDALKKQGATLEAPAAAEGAGGAGDISEDALRAVSPFLEKIQNALQSSIDYYHRQGIEGELDRIILWETGAGLGRFERYIELNMDVPIVRPVWEGMRGIECPLETEEKLKTEFESYLPVIGAFVNWRSNGVNLLPKSTIFKVKTRNQSRLLRVGVIVLVALFSVTNLYFGLLGSIKGKEVRSLTAQTAETARLEELYKQSQEPERFKEEMKKGDLDPYALMKLLSVSAPADTLIQEIQFIKPTATLDMTGRVYATADNPIVVATQLVRSLGELPDLRKVELTEGIREPQTQEYRFRILAKTE